MPETKKTILITGASKGIGKAMAETLSQRGANLILVDIEKIDLHSLNISTYQADLTKTDEIADLVSVIQKNHPKIDVLINNAGIGIYKGIEDLSLKEWDLALNLNVTAPFLLMKNLLPNLKASTTEESKPLILNIGSGCGKKGIAERSSYCATKFALRGLSFSLYEELKPDVNVLYLALGSVATEFGPLSAEEKLKSKGKKYLSPQDVAKKVAEIIQNGAQDLPAEIEFYPENYFKTLGAFPQ